MSTQVPEEDAAYALRVRRNTSNATGTWWVASVADIRAQGAPIDFGRIFVPNSGRLRTAANASLSYLGGTAPCGDSTSVGILGPWFQANTLAATQAFAEFPSNCDRSDVSNCIYGAGCGPQRALLSAGGTTARTAVADEPLWNESDVSR
jgi:hypothetical protein